MIKISIVCVGKIKEKFFRDAIEEYSKRLGRYTKLNIIEVTDEMTPDGASAALEDQIREKEGGKDPGETATGCPDRYAGDCR